MRRALGRALAASAALLLAGCGVQGTGVVEAGGPATVNVYPDEAHRLLLFFVGPERQLVPVARSADTNFGGPEELHISQEAIGKSLAALAAGPLPHEQEAGLESALPPPPVGALRVTRSAEFPGRVEIRASFSVRRLPEHAVLQLVCTTAYAADTSGAVEVLLIGPDGGVPASRCAEEDGADARPTPQVAEPDDLRQTSGSPAPRP
ncbi:hypothetical protein [Streptomyces sp. MUM 178J]|uniref:hypothetical protein n=1 Tax=Streptomyces sp. MUM 178J TaxID=2791991 RepID=UPI001F046439|nr:hypothetical protein [Streptomyces sp. MUM 178J]WRQ79264.1 hypothetical protein I3F59_007715 [Streptomyces sp. MUM 178J]